MSSDRTLRFPCEILFGRPRDTSSSPTNSETRSESVLTSARERVKLSRERMKTRYDSRAKDHHLTRCCLQNTEVAQRKAKSHPYKSDSPLKGHLS
ncbi:hypothetical protein AVEN_243238-1 [Araneus ventricosus]|uniref:Uncharacterized protein n=1 Tax=Araneus ventricosus TaxID=182803 RepID=A0A4Y2T7Q9_ARAVE|nr:hypothetical protein AVEN_243238-1 [Araneus ventricosus]